MPDKEPKRETQVADWPDADLEEDDESLAAKGNLKGREVRGETEG